jgi:pimeloyl-ACP methyl ester carboxylesterase
MEALSSIGTWISNNESLLSGAAAIIVLLGVTLSALSLFARRMADRGQTGARKSASAMDEVITLTDLSAPAPYPVHYAESDGLRIAYASFGNGPHNIMMAPGLISHLNVTANLPPTRDTSQAIASFAKVLTFDKRGQGLSDPCLNVPDLAERVHDIEAVLDAAGQEQVILYGVSEGGPMCIKFACDHPERVKGLVLVGSTARWLQSADYPVGIEERVLDRLTPHWGEGSLRDIFFPSISRERMDDKTYQAFEHLIASRKSIFQLVEFMKQVDVRDLLPLIRCPTMVVHFSGDMAIPLRMGRAMADAIPGAEFVELPGIDHNDLTAAPEGIECIKRFADSLA